MRGDRKVIEWVPGKFWVVEETGKDGSYTPLYHDPETFSRAKAEAWLAANVGTLGGSADILSRP